MIEDNLIPILENHIGIKIYDRVRGMDVIVNKIENDRIYCRPVEDSADFVYAEDGKIYGYPHGIVALVLSRTFADITVLDWKEGDILVSYPFDIESHNKICIFKQFINDSYLQFKCSYIISNENKDVTMSHDAILNTVDFIIDEREKAKSVFSKSMKSIIDADFNFEKNRPRWEDVCFDIDNYIVVEQKNDEPYICKYRKQNDHFLFVYDCVNMKGEHFIPDITYNLDDIVFIRHATESEINTLNSAIAEVDSIIDMDSEIEDESEIKLKPFDQVLVRDRDEDPWEINMYGRYISNTCYVYRCINGDFCQCVPYKGNEKLLGTTNKTTK